MSRELFSEFIKRSYGAVFCALLLGAALTSGCATIAGKPARAENPARTSGNNQTAELTGKWYKTDGSRFDYARYAENLGDFEALEITAGGRIKTETLNVSRSYDCLVEVAAESEGTISFAAGAQELNISLAAGQTRKTNSCSAEKNSTAATAATVANYRWKLAENENGATELCLTAAGGKTTCYRRED